METTGTDTNPLLEKPLIHFGRRVLERTAPGTAPAEYRLLRIASMTPHIGAEIEGVDLSRPIGEELAEE
ncbi:taurine dioxygenase, partial [Streptomyces sp. JA03]|nr:taurine dioxygenase [Streptomyces barringtoniae]